MQPAGGGAQPLQRVNRDLVRPAESGSLDASVIAGVGAGLRGPAPYAPHVGGQLRGQSIGAWREDRGERAERRQAWDSQNHRRSAASPSMIALARSLENKASTLRPSRWRQFGRSRSVPGRLVAIVSPARSSACAVASTEAERPTKACAAPAIESGRGRSKLGASAISPAWISASASSPFSRNRA